MAVVTKRSFRGYNFQFNVALLFCYFLEFYKNEFIRINCEIGTKDLDHKFDDFEIVCPDKKYYFQVKNCSNPLNEEPKIRNNSVYYCNSISKLNTNGINVFVCYQNKIIRNKFNGNIRDLKTVFYKKYNLHILYLNQDIITSYIKKNCINEERRMDLYTFFSGRLMDQTLDSFSIEGIELPIIKSFSNMLECNTLSIRNTNIAFKYGINFIFAPPGYGKSHLVNELGIDDCNIYRFWISQGDRDLKERLHFSNFIEELENKLFEEKRKRTIDEIVQMIDEKEYFAIDGIDHVYNYSKSDFDSYLDFLRRLSNCKRAKVLVLSRKLSVDITKGIDCLVIELGLWKSEESDRYLINQKVSEKKIRDKIFTIAKGYPILTFFLSSEYLKTGSICENNIANLNDYYESILKQNDLPKSFFDFFCLIPSFIHEKDFDILDDLGLIKKTICDFAKKYPYLILHKNSRLYLYHDSLYNFFNKKSNKYPTINKKIFNHLYEGNVNFMSRFTPLLFAEESTIKLLKRFADISFFLTICRRTFDYESIKEFYFSLQKSFNNYKEKRILNFGEIYSFVLILLLLNRNYYKDNPMISIQIFNQIKNVQKKQWSDFVFSDGFLFTYLSKISSYKETIIEGTSFYDSDYFCLNFEKIIHNEFYFDFIEKKDICDLCKKRLINANFIEPKVLGEFLVAYYIHRPNEYSIRKIVDDFRNYGFTDIVFYKLRNSINFLSSNINYYAARRGLELASLRLASLAITDEFDGKTLKEIISINNTKNSFKMGEILNSFLCFCNLEKKNIEVDLNELYPYLLMMDASDDATVSYLPEAMSFFVKKHKLSVKKCYSWNAKVYQLRDSGNKHFVTEFINELGPGYFDILRKNSFFSKKDFSLIWSSLSPEILNKIAFNDILTNIYIPDTTTNLNIDEYSNIIHSKHKKDFIKFLKFDGYKLTRSSATSIGKDKHLEYIKKYKYYLSECKGILSQIGLSIEEVSELKDPYGGFIYPSIDMFDSFEDNSVSEKLYGLFTSSICVQEDIWQKFSSLVYTFPALLKKYKKKASMEKMCEALKMFINAILLGN